MAAEHPKRKRPARCAPVERSNAPTVLFVTACLRGKASIDLADQAVHAALLKSWEEASAWKTGAYLIMPDHVHLFCTPGVWPSVPVRNWAKFWKGRFRRYRGLSEAVWQRDVWDTQMRNYSHYVEKREYVRRNPVRKELVAYHGDWPYQGEMHVIRW